MNQLFQNVTRYVRNPHGWELNTKSSFLVITQFIVITVGYQASLFHVISINLQCKVQSQYSVNGREWSR